MFAALVGVTAAQGVQIVGALLVMSLLITPAAAAVRVFVSPVATIVASVVFAEISAVGGIVLSLAPGVPVSVFVTTISFAIFLVCWLVGRRPARRHPASQPCAVLSVTRGPPVASGPNTIRTRIPDTAPRPHRLRRAQPVPPTR